ncbi:helix-turn-helix transcriptional regulator [Staphylococcus sp. GDY8P11P]|uniref:helix-turn-helix domain-containing protein n=1 Tax=Staphylococcus sp. GDY8P11P TaxID=2804410 RepID=UPI00194F5899|nr:helix-turn-helix transcriptional regulator [Staphylococcus sp. GDY8P11P]
MKNEFRVILAERKLKISDVYSATGIAKTTLYGLYHEKTTNPSMPIIMKLCDYLNITPNEFFGIEKAIKEA